MPQVVADVLERQALAEQPGRTRMPQGVRPVMPEAQATRAEHATGEVIQPDGREGSMRRLQCEKDRSPRTTGTHLGEVPQQRMASVLREG